MYDLCVETSVDRFGPKFPSIFRRRWPVGLFALLVLHRSSIDRHSDTEFESVGMHRL